MHAAILTVAFRREPASRTKEPSNKDSMHIARIDSIPLRLSGRHDKLAQVRGVGCAGKASHRRRPAKNAELTGTLQASNHAFPSERQRLQGLRFHTMLEIRQRKHRGTRKATTPVAKWPRYRTKYHPADSATSELRLRQGPALTTSTTISAETFAPNIASHWLACQPRHPKPD